MLKFDIKHTTNQENVACLIPLKALHSEPGRKSESRFDCLPNLGIETVRDLCSLLLIFLINRITQVRG